MGQELIPANNVLVVVFLEVDAELLNEPRLQLVDTTEALLLYAFEAVGVVTPLVGGALVATKVDILEGEHLGHMAQHALKEIDDLVLAHVEHILGDATIDTHLIVLGGVATELGVSGHSGHHVTGKVNLGHDLNVTVLGISHDLTKVVESEEHATAILGVVEEMGGATSIAERSLANATHGGELGIFGDFDAPALVVGEMPVETVHLIRSHDVEHALHLGLREEVASHIEHITTMAKLGLIGNSDAGHAPIEIGGCLSAIDGMGHELLQGLQRIEEASGIGGGDTDALCGDVEGVSLVGQRSIGCHEDGTCGGSGIVDAQRDASHSLKLLGEFCGVTCGGLIDRHNANERTERTDA